MKQLKKDLQGMTKEFKTLTKKIKDLTNKLTKTAVAKLERAQAAIKLKSPAHHAADALKTLTKQTENLIKAVDKFENKKAAKKKKAKPKAKAKVKPKARVKKAPAKKKTVARKKTLAKKAPAKKKTALTATDKAVNIINRAKKGVDAPTLMKKTGLADKQIRNILHRAFKQGKIKRAGRGTYVAA